MHRCSAVGGGQDGHRQVDRNFQPHGPDGADPVGHPSCPGFIKREEEKIHLQVGCFRTLIWGHPAGKVRLHF